jgi:hypothetical protein
MADLVFRIFASPVQEFGAAGWCGGASDLEAALEVDGVFLSDAPVCLLHPPLPVAAVVGWPAELGEFPRPMDLLPVPDPVPRDGWLLRF